MRPKSPGSSGAAFRLSLFPLLSLFLAGGWEAGNQGVPGDQGTPVCTMIQNFGGDGLSHYGVWFEPHQADFIMV